MTNIELINIAKNARKNAVVGISNYSVGAALISDKGNVYLGANIEDKALPTLSSCAERVAIYNALTYGEKNLKAIAIVGGKCGQDIDKTLIPCGICRQFMIDMCKDIDVICYIDGKLVGLKPEEFSKFSYEFKE